MEQEDYKNCPRVRVETIEGCIYEGTLSPSSDDVNVELLNAHREGAEDAPLVTRMLFLKDELLDIQEIPKKRRVVQQCILSSVMIGNSTDLENFILLVKNKEKVGISFFFGPQCGMSRSLQWILCCCRDTIFVFDIPACSNSIENFWDRFNQELLSNQDLLKICHDARPIVQFCENILKTKFRNFFDTQFSEGYISHYVERYSSINSVQLTNKKIDPFSLRPLHVVLKRLSNVSKVEMKFLEKFEKVYMEPDSPKNKSFVKRPISDDKFICKGMALSVKHLISLHALFNKLLMSHFNACMKTHVESVFTNQSRDSCLFVAEEVMNLMSHALLTFDLSE